jgi:alanyl-tRNA synthetase
MTSQELRQKYLDFFVAQAHTIIPSASLIPENDPTVLFTTAGMHPLVPYLLGQTHPSGKRLVDAQKCIRTGDIDEVGDLTHLTFFEMLGNWSLGDYFKAEAIAWSWEFLTSDKWLGLDKSKLAVSVFVGDADAPFDQTSYDLWLEQGVASERIAKLGKEDNWWGPAGQTGPCGPDTEMFYWTGETEAPKNFQDTHTDPHWVEIWNNVFMAYEKTAAGSFVELAHKNVDTGMGLERTLCVINNQPDIYQTDLFAPIILAIEKMSNKIYANNSNIQEVKAFRVIADHIKAAAMIMGDDKGMSPSNADQGYIVRRLIRRAIRYANILDIQQTNWIADLGKLVIKQYGSVYPELTKRQAFVLSNLTEEADKFSKTLEKGLHEFAKLSGNISGHDAFNLYQSYGFPIEMTEELAKTNNLSIDINGFEQEMNKHQELSRTAAAGKFKGGLADHSEETTRLHTAAHLMLAALRKVLGNHVEQKGSNITAERLRFDFSQEEKMTAEQIAEVEKLVNQAIVAKLPVDCQEMSLEEAKQLGATGVFESKYGERVKVYIMGQGADNFSKEICGGPHVANTGELGTFKIKKEESSSAGVRRIKAILE